MQTNQLIPQWTMQGRLHRPRKSGFLHFEDGPTMELSDAEVFERECLLRNPKRDSVEELRLEELNIMRSAYEFRYGKRNFPSAFYRFLALEGVEIERSILLSVGRWGSGVNPLFGEILSQREHVLSFDFDFSEDGAEILRIIDWTDLTRAKKLNEGFRGVPKTQHRIAIDVLRRLNSEC